MHKLKGKNMEKGRSKNEQKKMNKKLENKAIFGDQQKIREKTGKSIHPISLIKQWRIGHRPGPGF